jgi:DNA-binding MarR family transcriptional regulator
MAKLDEATDVETTWRLAADLRVAVGRLARRLRQEQQSGDLSFPEISVLSRLDREGPASPGRLAAAERVKPQAMAVTVAKLEARTLVARVADAGDARRALLSIAGPGLAVLTQLRNARNALLTRGLADFDEAELGRLHDALPLLERLAASL